MSKLVLLRHGESVWNKQNVFTGWVDVPLSLKGTEDALLAGDKIADIEFDVIYVSDLVRSMQTALLSLVKNKSPKTPVVICETPSQARDWAEIYDNKMRQLIIPIYRDWRVNERYYGKLQGLNKGEIARKYGDKQLHTWRRSYDIAPPDGESLKDTSVRVLKFLADKALPMLAQGKNVLVAAHGNSLRAMVMHFDKLTPTEVENLEIPMGDPLVYIYQDGVIGK